MADQEDIINLGKIVFDDNNQKRKSWACLGQTCSRSVIVFLSHFVVVLFIIFGWFWRIHSFQKLMTNQLFGLEVCAERKDTFYPHQDYEQVNFYKKSSLYFLVSLSETGKSQPVYNWLKTGTFQPKFD